MNLLDTVFEWVVSTTIRASLVAIAILAIQMLLRPWLPAKWRHPLWLPLLLVMILPFVPALPVHLIPPRQAEASPVPMTAELGTTHEARTDTQAVAPVVSAPHKTALLPILWLAGVCVTMAAGITGYRCKLDAIRAKAVAPAPALQVEIEDARKAAGLSRAPVVWLSREVESPAVAGLLRPVLLLPEEFPAEFTAVESRLILLHEFTHIKRHDLAQNWLLFTLQALHWFNPVIWFAFARVRMDRETACDARVLALDAHDRRSEYGHALLKMQGLPAVSGLRLGFLGIFENISGLRTRITDISRYRRSHPAWQVVGSLLVAMIALFGSTRAEDKKEEAPAPKEAPMTPAQAAIAKKLDTIMMPLVSLEDTSIEEAIDFIRVRSRELDTEEKDPARKGLNFVIRKARGAAGQEPWKPGRLTFVMKNVPIRRVLTEIAAQSGTRYSIDDFAVTFVPAGEAELPEKVAPQPQAPKGKAAEAAKTIIVPVVDVEDATLTEVVDFLNLRAKELGGANAPVIKIGPNTKGDAKVKELRLRNVPLLEAVRYVTEATKNTMIADDTGLQIGK